MARPRVALGKGAEGLFLGPSLTPVPTPTPTPASTTAPAAEERTVFSCPIDLIVPHGGQPRQHFDKDRLAELTNSIRDRGLIEPIIVRRLETKDGAERYEIIAGERRWRASKEAGLSDIQVIVKDLSSNEAFEIALIENIQREDLNPIELAEAYHRLLQEHDYTHDQIADLVRKNRATITNTMRLLRLPPRVRTLVLEGRLTEGHARALMGLDDTELLEQTAEAVLRDGLTVRETETLVQSLKPAEPRPQKQPKQRPPAPPNLRDLEDTLARHLGAMVQIRNNRKNQGQIVISYSTLDELDRLLAQIRQ